MEHLSTFANGKRFFTLSLLFLVFSANTSLQAQERNFGVIYSDNIRGGSTLFGNTLEHLLDANGLPNIAAMNGNSVTGYNAYTNGGSAMMGNVDIDGNTGFGAATRNSSSADLVLPAGTNTIKFAKLYWGGRVSPSDFDLSQTANQTIKIRKGTTGAYSDYLSTRTDIIQVTEPGTNTQFSVYQACVDVTSFIQENGTGTYSVGNAALSIGLGGAFGNYGGWSLAVVYENPTIEFNSIRVFDGFLNIYDGDQSVTKNVILTGLNVPAGALNLTDAKIGVVVWEGDSKFGGDSLQVNNTDVSSAVNPIDNIFNGTISDYGSHTATKNPNYTDQMGLDIDQFYVGTGFGILPNATTAKLSFGTKQDQYFTGVITFVVKVKEPIIKLEKTVTDANNSGTAEPGEVLTYKIKAKNSGAGKANFVVITDVLPGTLTYLNNSLKLNYAPGNTAGSKTDVAGDDIAEYNAATKTVTFRIGNGANVTAGGTMGAPDSAEVEFQVVVNIASNGITPPIINVARITAKSDGLVEYTDDATAVINPQGGPLPVTLLDFTANLLQTNTVKLAWTTSTEYNSKSFEIQRSTDGVTFTSVATKNAAGNSNIKLLYTLNDDISSVTSSTVYYRLKQIDIDGKAYVSKVVSVRLKKAVSNFTVSPNPFQNNININIEWNKNETAIVKVYNIDGKEIVSKSVNFTRGLNYVSIEELARVLPGNYVIQFNTSEGKLFKQVVKQK